MIIVVFFMICFMLMYVVSWMGLLSSKSNKNTKMVNIFIGFILFSGIGMLSIPLVMIINCYK